MSSEGEWPELVDGEMVLQDEATVLYRQIHPSWVQGDTITSQAFKPTPKDSGQLSTRQASKLSAEDAYVAHTAEEGLRSVGTYQVTAGEVASVRLRSIDDSGVSNRPNGHAYIDCRNRSNRQIEKAAKVLRTQAMQHGPQFTPT